MKTDPGDKTPASRFRLPIFAYNTCTILAGGAMTAQRITIDESGCKKYGICAAERHVSIIVQEGPAAERR